MVISKFESNHVQRWVMLVVCVIVCVWSTTANAQNSYQNNSYRIYSNQPSARVARAPKPTSRLPDPFRVEVADPPNPFVEVTETPKSNARGTGNFNALSKAFAAGTPRTATPSGRIQDIFGENPQDDAFGEQNSNPVANPFKKIEGSQAPTAVQEPELSLIHI